MTPTEKQILTQLQRGIGITSQPFAPVELEVLQRTQADGLLRRFGGVFDARRLGYKSILCALEVPAEQLEEKAAIIVAHPGVTHCYERTPIRCRAGRASTIPALQKQRTYPNLWFTFAVLHDEFDSEWDALSSKLETRNPKPEIPSPKLIQLPATRRFKIDVVFDLHTRNRDESFPGRVPVASGKESFGESFRIFSEEEKALIRAMDQQLPLVKKPFAAVAEQLGQSEEWVLDALRGWREQGVLRRIGAILYHREAGFKANAMCVWPVSGDASAAGRRVAARSEVTHCYQRPCLEAFSFDLYAMIHTTNWDKIDVLFKEISESCGLSAGELFASCREFKKSSMRYFL